MSQRILIIDDDDFTAILVEGLIGDSYRIEHYSDGEQGLNAALANPPDLILMDVEMPVMDGYTACRRVRQEGATQHIPVIFLSAHVETADRLAGYDAGGDDYVTKPFDPTELRHKIEIVLRNHRKNRESASPLSTTSAGPQVTGDPVIIAGFLRELLSAMDFGAVADCLLRTADTLGIHLSLQLRDRTGSLSRSRDGICSPLEESILTKMSEGDALVILGTRAVFNWQHVTLIAKNLPRDNPERYEYLKTMLEDMVWSTEARMQSIAVLGEVLARGDKFLGLLKSNTETLREIEIRYHDQRTASAQILSDLINHIENSYIHLGLTDSQEAYLSNTLRSAVEQAQALYDEDVKAEALMRELSQGMDEELLQEVRGVVDASAGSQNIELF